MQSVKHQKIKLREELRTRRKNLSTEVRQTTSLEISRQLRQLDIYKEAETIGVYLATAEEVSLDPFIVQARLDGKKLLLPVISKVSGEKRMFLQHWSENDELTENRFGISEPHKMKDSVDAGTRATDTQLDLLLMPLVGYTRGGSRLGMGVGYYDRYLNQLGEHSKTQRIGIAHSCQEQDNIPQNEWDRKMHMLINEHEVLRFLVQSSSSFY